MCVCVCVCVCVCRLPIRTTVALLYALVYNLLTPVARAPSAVLDDEALVVQQVKGVDAEAGRVVCGRGAGRPHLGRLGLGN